MVLEKSYVFHSAKGGVGKSVLLYNTLGALVRDADFLEKDCSILIVDCSLYHDISRKLLGDTGLETGRLEALDEKYTTRYNVERLQSTADALELDFDTPEEHAHKVTLEHFQDYGNLYLMASDLGLSKLQNIPPRKVDISRTAESLRSRLNTSGRKWYLIVDSDAEYHNLTLFSLALCDEAFMPMRLQDDDWFRVEVALNRLTHNQSRKARIAHFIINDLQRPTDIHDHLLTADLGDGQPVPRFRLTPHGQEPVRILLSLSEKLYQRFQSDHVGGNSNLVFVRKPNKHAEESLTWFEREYCDVVRNLGGTMLKAMNTGSPIAALTGLDHTGQRIQQEFAALTRNIFNLGGANLAGAFNAASNAPAG